MESSEWIEILQGRATIWECGGEEDGNDCKMLISFPELREMLEQNILGGVE